MLQFIIDLWLRHLQPLIDKAWSSSFCLRTICLLLLTIIVVIIVFRKRLTELLYPSNRKEHDRKLFESFNSVITEEHIKDLLDRLYSDHSYMFQEIQSLWRAQEFLEKTGNRFLSSKLENQAKQLLHAIRSLHEFITLHFFECNSPQQNDIRLCMHPDWNIDRGGTGNRQEVIQYEKMTNNLNSVIKTLFQQYNTFRDQVKKELYI